MTQNQDILQAIFDRRSIRHFKPEPLTDEQIATLAKVALASPSAMNHQPWLFHFIRNQQVITSLSEATLQVFRDRSDQATLERMASRHPSIFYGAPLLVIISLPRDENSHYSKIDAGIAVENLAIAAQSLGLASCIIGLVGVAFSGSQKAAMAKLAGLPDDREFAISIAIGHPDTNKDAHEQQPDHIVWID